MFGYLSSSDSEEISVVEKILNHRTVYHSVDCPPTIQFEVKWSGSTQPQWTDYALLSSETKMILEYLTDTTRNDYNHVDIATPPKVFMTNQMEEKDTLIAEDIEFPDLLTEPVQISQIDLQSNLVTYLDINDKTGTMPIRTFIQEQPALYCSFIASALQKQAQASKR